MSDTKTLPNVGQVRELEFTPEEQKFLAGMCGSVYQRTPRQESKAVWALLAKKVKQKTFYSEQELLLLSKAIDTTLSACDNRIKTLQPDGDDVFLEARLRAQAVMSMFRSIKEKIVGPEGTTTEGSKNE